jgi:hypothetical protein
MAVNRYDQRRSLEEAEANAIGTEYVRAGLLPAADAARVRKLLVSYLDQRILFYSATDLTQLQKIDETTAKLQNDLWTAVEGPVAANPTPVAATVATGMNDVLNSQSYTQAAWWNRIPTAAWILMLAIGIACNGLVGYNSRRSVGRLRFFFILPGVVAVSFFLIADMESPRKGGILVPPQNLMSLASSIRGS